MRWLGLVLVAAILVVGAWWLAGGESKSPSMEIAGPGWKPAATTEVEEESPRIEPTGQGAALTRQSANPLEPAVQPSNRQRIQRREIRVLVVDAEEGAPVPGALLSFLDRRAAPDWARNWSEPGVRLQFLRRNARTVTAGEDGTILIPATDNGYIAAKVPGFHGELEWTSLPAGDLTLQLTAEVDLRVRVLDHTGRPRIGVPVSILRDSGGSPVPVITRMSAGDDSLATFPRIRQLIGTGQPGARYRVALAFPCKNGPFIELDGLNPPSEVLELRMPATGRLVVRVVDEAGAPLGEVANATLGATLDEDGRPLQYGATTQRIVGGRATFPFVGVGSRFELRLDGSRKRPPLTDEGEGPSQPGEEKEVVLAWEGRHPVLVGRAVNETGQPLVQRRGTFQLRRGNQAFAGPPVTTDGSGRFELILDSSRGPLVGASVLTTLNAARGEAPLECSIVLDATMTTDAPSVRDFTFRPVPRLAAGRVVDAGGTGLFGVHVRAEVRRPDGSWGLERNLSSTTDRDGQFVIHGRTTASGVRVVALRSGYEEARAGPVSPGGGGLQLILRPRGPR